jgi:hypothetical protein
MVGQVGPAALSMGMILGHHQSTILMQLVWFMTEGTDLPKQRL